MVDNNWLSENNFLVLWVAQESQVAPRSYWACKYPRENLRDLYSGIPKNQDQAGKIPHSNPQLEHDYSCGS